MQGRAMACVRGNTDRTVFGITRLIKPGTSAQKENYKFAFKYPHPAHFRMSFDLLLLRPCAISTKYRQTGEQRHGATASSSVSNSLCDGDHDLTDHFVSQSGIPGHQSDAERRTRFSQCSL